jgi:hypothetical protein
MREFLKRHSWGSYIRMFRSLLAAAEAKWTAAQAVLSAEVGVERLKVMRHAHSIKEITSYHLKDWPVRFLSESAGRSGIRRIFHSI